MTLLAILLISIFVAECVRTFHVVIQKTKGYRWWYRNVYLRTPHWKFTRKFRLWLSGRKCSVCRTNRQLDVHHKSYKHMWWEWLFVWELEVLCRHHHAQHHGR